MGVAVSAQTAGLFLELLNVYNWNQNIFPEARAPNYSGSLVRSRLGSFRYMMRALNYSLFSI